MKLFDVRAGEGRKATIALGAMFTVVAAHTVLETVRDALFLSRLGPGRLAIAMALLALVSLVAVRFSGMLIRALGQRDALLLTLVASAWGTGIFAMLPATPACIFSLYLFSALIGTLLLAQLWTCASDEFTVAQGRRLFPLIGAGAVVGAICGALGTAGWLLVAGYRPLLLVTAGLFLSTGLLVTLLPGNASFKIGSEVDAGDERAEEAPRDAVDPVHEASYVRRVAVLVGLASATVLAADYLFKTTVAAVVPRADIGEFLARYYAVTNVAALLVQLLLARPLLRRLGVAGTLLVMPLALLAGASGIVLAGGALVAVLVLKGLDGSMRHSLQRLCTELVVLPLSFDVRSRSKPLFDGVIGRGVQAAGSMGLFCLSSLHLATTPILSVVVGALAVAWTVSALSLRAPYLGLFRHQLARGTVSTGADLPLDTPAIEGLVQAISSRDDAHVIAALESLRDHGAAGMIPGLALLHTSERVLERALGILSKAKRDDWQWLAERLLAHPAAAVRLAAAQALGPGRTLAASLESPGEDPAMRAIAAFARANGDAAMTHPRLSTLIGETSAEGRKVLIDAIAADGDARWSTVLGQVLNDASVERCSEESTAIARVGDVRFLPRLVENLALPALRAKAREALVSFGDRGLDALSAALSDPALAPRVRSEIPLAMARFRSQRAADVLVGFLAGETSGAVRYRILRGLGTLTRDPAVRLSPALIERELARNLVEHGRVAALLGALDRRTVMDGYVALLVELMEDKRAHALERTFRLLQLAHRGEDLRSLHHALHSPDAAIRANAFEFLDALTSVAKRDRTVVELLRLAVDDLPRSERGLRARKLVDPLPEDPDEVVALLAADHDPAVSALAARHAAEMSRALGDPRARVVEPAAAEVR